MHPTLVTFLGALGRTRAERLVDDARIAATRDILAAWAGPAIVATDDPALPVSGATVDLDQGDYHFGRRLAGIVRRHGLQRIVYLGGGSLPLLPPESLRRAARRAAPGSAVTNNLYSSDLIAFDASERTLSAVAATERDNALARALKEDAGVSVEELPRSPETLFDIDAPSDVLVLALTGRGGEQIRAYCAALTIDLSRYRALLPLFLDQDRQIIIAGRVGSHAWAYLERETACRVRLFAEERGMEAGGRTAAGSARSLLAYHLEAVGLQRFFQTLSALGDAAVIDTRVLLAHNRIEASREDRFLSDLGRWREVGQPWLREFTRAAAEAPLPVLLGGHSLVSGGLMALNEHAWALRDAGRL